MLEIPEATTLARQVTETLAGKTISAVVAAASPHKFAWYHGDPADYPARLSGAAILSAAAHGGLLEVALSRATLLFSDGVNLRSLPPGQPPPPKHQLLLTFSDGSALVGSVQMYGGLSCWSHGEVYDNPYYQVACQKPSPLCDAFSAEYFTTLLSGAEERKLSLKAALATGQHIPGLGNGVLQDILWHAGLNPKRKTGILSAGELTALFASLKCTLAEMTRLGGRDTEKDLFGSPGGYAVVMSAKNNGAPCPNCGSPIKKEAYLGGSVYYCGVCQPL